MSKKKKPAPAPLAEQLAPLASGSEVVEPETKIEKETVMSNETSAAPEVKPEVTAAPEVKPEVTAAPAPAEPVAMAAPVVTRSVWDLVKASLPFVAVGAVAGGAGYYLGKNGVPSWK